MSRVKCIPQGERPACVVGRFVLVFGSVLLLLVVVLLFCTPPTRRLLRIDFDFWVAAIVMQGAYHY